ncbi:hypothetical protein GQ457_17G023130 [Hibiscus cannabinus]
MALATVYATIPAVVAAAVGIYSFDRVRSSMGSMPAKVNQMVQTTPLPKVAPQFDGLNCFETLASATIKLACKSNMETLNCVPTCT